MNPNVSIKEWIKQRCKTVELYNQIRIKNKTDNERIINEINKNNCSFEPIEAPENPEFRSVDKTKFLTKKGFNLRMKTCFGGTLDSQAWKCIEEYPLRENYKGGFNETGNFERKRDKNKELSKDFNATNPKDIWDKRLKKSMSIRSYKSNNAINKIKTIIKKKDNEDKYKKIQDVFNSEEKNMTLYTWFKLHPAEKTIENPSCNRNAKTTLPATRMKLYKKSLEQHYSTSGTCYSKVIGNFYYSKDSDNKNKNTYWSYDLNEKLNEIEQKLEPTKNIKTPSINFIRLNTAL